MQFQYPLNSPLDILAADAIEVTNFSTSVFMRFEPPQVNNLAQQLFTRNNSCKFFLVLTLTLADYFTTTPPPLKGVVRELTSKEIATMNALMLFSTNRAWFENQSIYNLKLVSWEQTIPDAPSRVDAIFHVYENVEYYSDGFTCIVTIDLDKKAANSKVTLLFKPLADGSTHVDETVEAMAAWQGLMRFPTTEKDTKTAEFYSATPQSIFLSVPYLAGFTPSVTDEVEKIAVSHRVKLALLSSEITATDFKAGYSVKSGTIEEANSISSEIVKMYGGVVRVTAKNDTNQFVVDWK